MTIHYSVSDHVATVTLDRPEALNALDLESLKELRAVLAEARDDEDDHGRKHWSDDDDEHRDRHRRHGDECFHEAHLRVIRDYYHERDTW